MIIPVLHRLVIKPEKFEEVDATIKKMKSIGLVVPDMDSHKTQASVDQGYVVAIGPTAFKDFGTNFGCAVGNKIAYAKFAGKFIKDPETSEDLLVINDEDVVCIVKDKTNE